MYYSYCYYTIRPHRRQDMYRYYCHIIVITLVYIYYTYYITLSGPIDDRIARTLVMQMMYLEAEDPTQVNFRKNTFYIERTHSI
jgi:hypothetical protein